MPYFLRVLVWSTARRKDRKKCQGRRSDGRDGEKGAGVGAKGGIWREAGSRYRSGRENFTTTGTIATAVDEKKKK